MIKTLSPEEMPSSQWQEIAGFNSLQAPFFTRVWHSLWFEIFGQEWQPLTLLVNNAVIAPLVRQNDLVTFSGGREIADYLDIVGPDNRKASAWQEILDYCRNQGLTRFGLFNVPQSSATLSFFKNYPKAQINKEDTTPIISLPNSWESYLDSLPRRDRHELKRKMGRFESKNPALSLVQSTNPKVDIEDLLQLMRLNSDKNKFLTGPRQAFFRKIPETFPEEILIFLLKSKEVTAAAMLAFRQGSSLLTYNSGYDQKNFSGAGFYLKAVSLKWAIENGFTEYNFLQGSERYKYDLGGKDFWVYSLSLNLISPS